MTLEIQLDYLDYAYDLVFHIGTSKNSMKLFSIGNIRHLESISTVIPLDFRPKDDEKTSNISYFVSHASPNYMEGDLSVLTVNPRIKHFDDVPERFDVKISPVDTISLQLSFEDYIKTLLSTLL